MRISTSRRREEKREADATWRCRVSRCLRACACRLRDVMLATHKCTYYDSHNKGVPCWSSLSPEKRTGSRDTLLVHNAAILAGVHEAALQILTLQDVPVDGSEKRVKHVLQPMSVASATPRPKTRRPRDSPESPGIVQTCLPGFPSL